MGLRHYILWRLWSGTCESQESGKDEDGTELHGEECFA